MATPEPGPTVVRAAVAVDADAIADIGIRSWEATYRGMIPDAALDEWIGENRAAWHALFGSRPADSPGRIWVAERDGRVIGYATTSPAKDNWLLPPHGAGEITNLYLDPEVIGSGAGRLLYEHSVADLVPQGIKLQASN